MLNDYYSLLKNQAMKKLLLLLCVSLVAIGATLAQRTVTGTVTDEAGDPLIGANVLVKGTTAGTVTDFDGSFTLNVPEGGEVLAISYTGYANQEVDLNSTTHFEITMNVDRMLLDEVVVTAYGSQRKREITGAVTSVKSEEVEKIQTSNVVQGLSGKVPGVQIINQSGQPGDAPTVRFRGIGSVNASNNPLYVVDGVPFAGNINAIAPQDIESITFLKDASANALYGSRGANGVIVITTKKAKTEGLVVSVDARLGVNSRAVPEYDIIEDPGEFYEVWFDRIRIGYINQDSTPAQAAQIAASGLVNGPFGLGYNNYDVADDQIVDPNTGMLNPNANLLYHDDWLEEMFDNSIRKETYVSLQSKQNNVNSFLSFGYLDDEGYAVNSGFERVSGRASFTFDVSEALQIGASANYANTIQDAPIQNVASNTYSNLFSWARNIAPIYPAYAYDENGDRIYNDDGSTLYDFGTNDDGIPGVRPYGGSLNALATSVYDIDQNILDNLSGRAYATINFLQDFSFTYNFSADYIGSNITALATPIGGDAATVDGRLTTTSNRHLSLAHQQLLSWSKGFGDHTISLLAAHESSDFNFRLVRGQKTSVLVSDVPSLNNATNTVYLEGFEKDYRIEGFLFRANYDFREKLFVNASYRRDGSSVFHPDNRWGNFYGVGVAYDIGREFFADASVVSNLRLKVSYGQQGNDAILYEDNRTIIGDGDNRNYYAYRNQYDVVNAGGGVPGVQFVTLGNPELVWETSTNINAGFEMGLLNDRILLGADYFERSVEDLLFFRPLPPSEGRGSFPDNVGDMENKGVEGSLVVEIVRTPDITWSVNLNATHFSNEITRLPQEFIDDGLFRLEEGRNRYEYYMREYAGIDREDGSAMWFIDVLDAEGNPTGERETTTEYPDADEYFIGKTAIPDIFGGFGTHFRWRDLSLNVGFAYQSGGYGYDGVYANLLPSADDIGHNYHKDVYDTWTPENPDARLPRIDVFDDDQMNTSSLFLTDLSYLSLNDVTLSYSPNFAFFEDIGIRSAQVYVSGNNLYLFSKRDGYDPRLSIVGNAINEYSIMRSISFGVKVQF